MAGILRGTEVFVEDQAEGSQIYNKGYYGTPLTGGGLKLDLMEAIYLVDSGRLEVLSGKRRTGPGHLLRLAHRSYDGFEIRYIVYRELRQRGYIVKPGQPPLDFRVFPRGGSPNKTPSKWWVAAISERSTFDQLVTFIERLKTTWSGFSSATVHAPSCMACGTCHTSNVKGLPGGK